MFKNGSDTANVKALIDQFHAKIKDCTQIALNCPKGGNEDWFNLIRQHNIEPVPENQKNGYYSQGVPITKGAFPSEMRKLYQILRYEVISEFRKNFIEDKLSFDASMLWDDFIRYMERFIEEGINKYIIDIKQKVGVSDIFANAFSGMNKYSVGLQGSNVNTKQCKSCGSPRLDENQYGECYFCGTLLFETPEKEAKCKKCGSPKFIEDQGKACRFCGHESFKEVI